MLCHDKDLAIRIEDLSIGLTDSLGRRQLGGDLFASFSLTFPNQYYWLGYTFPVARGGWEM